MLRSDSAFGRGDGVAGLVDTEVEHETATGLPMIKGRTLKGLLVEACADMLYALQMGGNGAYTDYAAAAQKLFGVPGSSLEDMGCLHVGSAQLPEGFRQRVLTGEPEPGKKYKPVQVLEAMTTIRHQTAVDATTGKPKDTSLRATRVVLKDTFFYAPLVTSQVFTDIDYELLAACAAGVKRGGQNRTRGLGWVHVALEELPEDAPADPFHAFANRIGGVA